jgi:hypothetical protein
MARVDGDSFSLARMFHESLAATTDMAVLPGVLGCRPLRRTVQVRLGTTTLRLPGGTPIFVVSPTAIHKTSGLLISWHHSCSFVMMELSSYSLFNGTCLFISSLTLLAQTNFGATLVGGEHRSS